MKLLILLGLILGIFYGCVQKDTAPGFQSLGKDKEIRLNNVSLKNNQLVLNGINLTNVKTVTMKNNQTNVTETFSISSKTDFKLIAVPDFNVVLLAKSTFDLILGTAEASQTFTINFSMCESLLGGKPLDCTAAPNDKEVLSYDAASGKWKPRSINGLNYIGAWDASGSATPTSKPAGYYYIVSVAGDIGGAYNVVVGDWIVSTGTAWEKIENSTAIVSVFGRTGAVTANEGDYNLNKLSDVDLSTAPTNNQILRFDGTNWKASNEQTIAAGSVTNTMIADSAVTDSKISGVAASKISGTLSGSQIGTGVITNTHISGTAAIDYSKINVPAGSIPYAKLSIADGDIPVAKVNGLATSISSIIEDAINNGVTNKAPTENAVYDALATKADLTNLSQTITTAAVTGLTAPVAGSDATNKTYVDGLVTPLSSSVSGKVAKAGDTMSGDLILDTQAKFKSGSYYTTVKGSSSAGSNLTFTLPVNAGTSGYVLKTDGAGVLSWIDPSSLTAGTSTVTSASITDGTIVDADISASAAIAQSKISGLTTALSGKEGTVTAGTTTQYYRGDKTWQTLNGAAVTNTAAGNISSTTVQTAINELDTEKQASITSSTSISLGSVTTNSQNGVNLYPYGSAAGNAGEIRFYELSANGSNYTSIKSPDSLTANINYVMPSTAPTAGQVLSTTAGGVMSWIDIPSAPITTVFGRSGTVVATAGDYTATQITNTAAGNIAATTVQAAINELDTEKQALITAGTTAQYYRGDKTWQSLQSDVQALTMSSYAAGTNTALATSDTLVGALGKLQGQITATNSSISGKESSVTAGTTAQYYRGDKTWQSLQTDVQALTINNYTVGTNTALANTDSLSAALGKVQGQINATNSSVSGKEASVTAGTAAQYYRGDKTWQTLNGAAVTNTAAGNISATTTQAAINELDTEKQNTSSLAADVRAVVLTGLSTATNAAIAATDSILGAFGKLQAQLSGKADLTNGSQTITAATVTGLTTPVAGSDAANKDYVDSFGQWTKSGSDVYRSGKVGIGTSSPGSALTVNGGVIVSTPPAAITGSAVNLANGNTQVLTSVGGTAITLSNMVHGGTYTLVIQDTTSRTYTFTGCNSSRFVPANAATVGGYHSVYSILTIYNGSTYDCYITWATGY